MLVRAVLFAGCNHKTLPPRGRILQLNVATMACTQCVVLQESFFVVLHFFGHVMASAKIQPKKMNFCNLGFGKLVLGIFGGLAFHHLAATKNIQAQEMKIRGFEPENWSQGLVFPFLAAAGHQKIQPKEMRIWGLDWQNCSREFSGTCALIWPQPATKKSSHRK